MFQKYIKRIKTLKVCGIINYSIWVGRGGVAYICYESYILTIYSLLQISLKQPFFSL